MNEFLDGPGEMRARMRALDWSRTPLGAPENWPQSLKTVVAILCDSRYAMWMAYGPALTFFCNDAYLPTLGIKSEWALGVRADQVWAEIWDEVGPRIQRVLAGGAATWDEALLLFLERSGFPEETYHTFSYSPIPDDDGAVAGMLCVVTEDTRRALDDRRLVCLRELAAGLVAARGLDEVAQGLRRGLSTNPKDLPFTLVYLFDDGGARARLFSATGMETAQPGTPPAAVLDDDSVWPLGALAESRETLLVGELERRFPVLPQGAWNQPPRQAVLVPIARPGQTRAAGVLIAGLNPYRPYDDEYAGFIELIAGQAAASIASARSFEDERRRAAALAELDRSKTAFFTNVSHEFRTPLTLMLAPLEDALNDGGENRLAPIQKERLGLAHRNSLRLLKMVNSLLDFSRIEAGRLEASFTAVDLAAYSTDLASSFRSACERAGLSLEVDCPPLPEPVYVDPGLWEQIVFNLLSNAFKFTFSGDIRVRLGATAAGASLSVTDTGTGIPTAELPRVFERFHRIEGARGRSFEGSGIGLALVAELVKLHGGTLRAESEEGRGSTFTVTVPFGVTHLPAGRIQNTQVPAGTAVLRESYVAEVLRWLPASAPAAGAEAEDLGASGVVAAETPAPAAGESRGSVLLADDNADMRDYLRRLLASRGYTVHAAGDGLEALERARQLKPDLILTDVMMPRLDGFGLLRELRADPELSAVPVVLLSARAGEEARIEGLDAGADDYLSKPFAAPELLARVNTNLSLARARRTAASELRALNEALEDRVNQRTRELQAQVAERERAEQALRQAQKMETLGHLTGGIAHDFNNLLTVIIGAVETLLRRMPPEGAPLKRHAQSALNSAQRAATLTRQLLAFARQQPLAPSAVDVGALVNGMHDLLRRSLGESILIEVACEPGLWPVNIDPNQLESAILNLAINARDAMPRGGELLIATANLGLDEQAAAGLGEGDPIAAGDYVAVSIKDSGSGMSPEVLARAFDPFFTTKGIGKGTGLGLSQVYGFVRQSGGTAVIDSAPDCGTTITLYLPRLLATAAAETRRAAPVPAAPTGETVLLVEDDESVRAASAEALLELGYRVLEAEDGDSALRLIDSDAAIDLMFTDIGLPGELNGRQLAAEARRRRPELKLLFASGYARDALARSGGDEEFALLNKPFGFDELAAALRRVLDAQPRFTGEHGAQRREQA